MKLIFFLLLVTACTKSNTETQGIVKGHVTDSHGKPIPNAKVVIENTVFYATYVYATTNANGFYETAVPNGSWQASVQIQKNYLEHLYTFDLRPDNADPFAGTTGATRNFTWTLHGAKPNGGFYGSHLAVYPEPGSSFLIEDVAINLAPDGLLADGSTGQIINKGLTDIGGGEYGIDDIPVGKYTITAKNKTTGQSLQVRMRNLGEYKNAVTGIFTAGFTGSTTYQIIIQIK